MDFIDLYKDKLLQEALIGEIMLFESILKPNGPVYQILERIKL
jgi:2'-5' RNA ligase